jgi:hypothetical protein
MPKNEKPPQRPTRDREVKKGDVGGRTDANDHGIRNDQQVRDSAPPPPPTKKGS